MKEEEETNGRRRCAPLEAIRKVSQPVFTVARWAEKGHGAQRAASLPPTLRGSMMTV